MIYVIPLYGVSLGLNLNLSSVGGRSLKLTDYYRAEARRYLPDRAKTEAESMRQSRGRGSKVETEARPCEAEARPSQLKNCLEAASSWGRCLEDYITGRVAVEMAYNLQCASTQHPRWSHNPEYVVILDLRSTESCSVWRHFLIGILSANDKFSWEWQILRLSNQICSSVSGYHDYLTKYGQCYLS